MNMLEWLEEVGIGIAAGFLSGLTGRGGGIIMIPLLVSLIHLDQRVAQGTSLLTFSMSVSALAARRYWRKGRAIIRTAPRITASIVPASILLAHFAQKVPTDILRKIFVGLPPALQSLIDAQRQWAYLPL